MIGYVMLGSQNIDVSRYFYSSLMKMMGAEKVADSKTFLAWSFGEGKPKLAIGSPFDGEDASYGNGAMVALSVSSVEEVDKLHKKALALGGQNEGDPGVRAGGFYCAYFRDLDGNKLNFHCKP
ncbi:MAG: catechol 2,3-dioxygenase-like lactoylglutathione lyase family enzyme [Moritella dasanensis]|jgi:catechol 2,3-dioxygenase-like lactoylglutathione lyase family enzyme